MDIFVVIIIFLTQVGPDLNRVSFRNAQHEFEEGAGQPFCSQTTINAAGKHDWVALPSFLAHQQHCIFLSWGVDAALPAVSRWNFLGGSKWNFSFLRLNFAKNTVAVAAKVAASIFVYDFGLDMRGSSYRIYRQLA